MRARRRFRGLVQRRRPQRADWVRSVAIAHDGTPYRTLLRPQHARFAIYRRLAYRHPVHEYETYDRDGNALTVVHIWYHPHDTPVSYAITHVLEFPAGVPTGP